MPYEVYASRSGGQGVDPYGPNQVVLQETNASVQQETNVSVQQDTTPLVQQDTNPAALIVWRSIPATSTRRLRTR